MASRQRGPREGHSTTALGLIERGNDGSSLECNICISAGKERHKATLRSAVNSSNLYCHLMLVHPSVDSILVPVIQNRDKNKRTKIQSIAISDMIEKSKQNSFEEALLCLYSSPDVSQAFLRVLISPVYCAAFTLRFVFRQGRLFSLVYGTNSTKRFLVSAMASRELNTSI